MSPETILSRSENASTDLVGDEAVLVDLITGVHFSLNLVSTQFWQMLDGERTIAQHAAVIAETYQVETAVVLADLLELVGEMGKDNLVEAVTLPESDETQTS